MELVVTPDLGSGAARCESSSLSEGTIKCRVRLAGLGHLPFTEKVTGSNPVRDTNKSGVDWQTLNTSKDENLSMRLATAEKTDSNDREKEREALEIHR